MPTLIISYSDVLCQFVLPLLGELSGAQQRHVLNLLHALVIGVAKHKLLTTLTRLLWVPHADHFALADFLRRSPWAVDLVRQALLKVVVQCALRVYAVVGGVVFLSLDDSLCVKTRPAEALHATSFYYDHVPSRRQYKHLSRAARVVALTLEVGGITFPLACRLYLKRAQVQAYNRSRTNEQPKLTYQRTHQIAYELLAEVQALLPAHLRVYVLCDAWYAATELFKRVRQYGWHYIAASKGDRKLGRFVLSEWWTHLSHQRVRYVHTHSTKGSHVYATRRVVGRLRRYPVEVVAVLSHRARRGSAPAYFVCSNTALSADTILKYYAHRWQIEVTFALLKEQLGWDDFRLQTIVGTERWLVLVWVAAAFLAVRRAEQWLAQPTQPVPTAQEVIAEQQRVQMQALVHHIYQRVQAGVAEPALLAELHLT